jgi:hypothetical protein
MKNAVRVRFDDLGILQMCDDRTARLRTAEGLSFEPNTLRRH